MGTDRRINKDNQGEKVSIAERLGVDKKELYDSLITFYKKIAIDTCIIDAADFVMKNIADTTIQYFFIIGLISFTKKYYGDSDYFKFEW